MSTTTIRLPPALRERVEAVAAASGSTPHAFIVDAVADATERMERRQDFLAEADRRLQHLLVTGEHLTLDDIRCHMAALAADGQADAPEPRRMSHAERERFNAAMRRPT